MNCIENFPGSLKNYFVPIPFDHDVFNAWLFTNDCKYNSDSGQNEYLTKYNDFISSQVCIISNSVNFESRQNFGHLRSFRLPIQILINSCWCFFHCFLLPFFVFIQSFDNVLVHFPVGLISMVRISLFDVFQDGNFIMNMIVDILWIFIKLPGVELKIAGEILGDDVFDLWNKPGLHTTAN